MSFHRRRYPYDNRLRRLLPLVFAVFLSLLILFAFLSFLAPFPGDSDRLPPRVRYSSNDAIKATGFRIPVSGFHYSSLKFETFPTYLMILLCAKWIGSIHNRELEADQIVTSGVHEMLNSFLDAAMRTANSQVRKTLSSNSIS